MPALELQLQVRSSDLRFELVRHSNAVSAIGEAFKQNAMFKWWVTKVTKYSDADECLFCGDTVLESQYSLVDWSTKWLLQIEVQKDYTKTDAHLFGVFLWVYLDSVLGSQLVRRLNRTKCNMCDTLTAFFLVSVNGQRFKNYEA
jgi:hypothetical protein